MQTPKNITWNEQTRTLLSRPSQYRLRRNIAGKRPSWRKNSKGIVFGGFITLSGTFLGLLVAVMVGALVDIIFGFADTEGWNTPGSYLFFAGVIASFAASLYFSSLSKWLKAVKKWKSEHGEFLTLFKARPHAMDKTPDYLAYMLMPTETAYNIVEVVNEKEGLAYLTVCSVTAPQDLHEAIALGVELAEEVDKLEAASKLEYSKLVRQKETDAMLAKEEAKSAALDGELRKQAMRNASGYSK